jgi:transposase-like protein
MDNTLEAVKSIAAPSKYQQLIFKDMALKGISLCIKVRLVLSRNKHIAKLYVVQMTTKENGKDVFMVAEGGSLEGLSSKIGGYLHRDVLCWKTLNAEDIDGRVVERKVRNKAVHLANPHVRTMTCICKYTPCKKYLFICIIRQA